MKSLKIPATIKATLYFIAFMAILVSCNTGQGMMHGSGASTYMGNWNWVGILIGLIIGFLLGYLVGRRKP